MILTLLNPDTTDLEKSYLNVAYSSGVATIEVKNNDRFATNGRIMIGEMGQEKTEVVTVSSVNANGTTVVVGTTVFSHEADAPVYILRFDQAKFYRSTTTSTGTYTLLATVNLDVDNANLSTLYDDTTGLTTYFYKMTVYHSISTLESAYSDPIAGAGWRREQVGNIIDEILQEVSDQNEINVTRSELLGYFNDVNDDLQINVSKPYSFLSTYTTLGRVLNTNYVAFPVDSNGKDTVWKFDRMDYNFTDTTVTPNINVTTTVTVVPNEEFRNRYSDNTVSSATVTDGTPVAMTIDVAQSRYLFSSPFETTDTDCFTLYYWKYFNTIDSEGDIIETPTAKIYKLYCKGMYYRKRAITESSFSSTSDRYFADFVAEKGKYKAIDRIDQGTPRSFRFETSNIKTYRH